MNDTNIRILGNMEIQALQHNHRILNIKNNINNDLFTISNNDINIYGNQTINGNLNSTNIYCEKLLKVPVYDNINNDLISKTGSIVFNKSSNIYEAYDNDKWTT